MKGRARLHEDEDPGALIDGVPAVEAIMEIEIGPCLFCGREPDGETRGMIENAVLVDGVLKGDSVCERCAAIHYPDQELI